jgi:hypothetical protein
MRYILFTILLLTSPIFTYAQVRIGDMVYILDNENLVQNGDFDAYEFISNPNGGSEFMFAQHWYRGMGTPDFYHVNNVLSNGVPHNSRGFQYPVYGNGYFGISRGVGYLEHEWTEAISGRLKYPLQDGKYLVTLYYVNAFVNQGNWVSIDRLGISLNNLPEYPLLTEIENLSLFYPVTEFAVIWDTLNWQKVELVIHAQGGETNLSIGSFSQSGTLIKELIVQNYADTARWNTYYYIDDVSMYRIIDSIPVADSITISHVHVYPNPSPNGQFTLEYAVHEDAQPVFGMYDATGRLVGKETLPGGQQRVPLDYSHLASGVYLWRLEQNGAFLGGGKVAVMR